MARGRGKKRVNAEIQEKDDEEYEEDGRLKKKEKTPQVEKRLARTRSSMNLDTMARVDRALTQRLYLLDQVDISRPGRLGRKYDVLGSTGNIYQVVIAQTPSCTCPDFGRGKLCKHILFVYLRVLRCQPRSTIIIQKALLQEELETLFSSRTPIASDVRASDEVMHVYTGTVKPPQEPISLIEEESEGEPVSAEEKKDEKLPEGECPICFEPMDTKESVERCRTCRNYIHSDCLRRWLTQAKTCVFCRSDWTVAKTKTGLVYASQVGGYLNIS